MPAGNENLIVKYSYPVGGAILGVFSACLDNYYRRRPNFSGIQRHIAYAVGFSLLGYILDEKMKAYYSERDAMLRHYIELHPEDFHEEKRKYRDIFEPWQPHR